MSWLSPKDSAPLYVEMMGGTKRFMAKGKEFHEQGKYRHAHEILNKLVFTQARNHAAKDLLADVLERIGYQQESMSIQNSLLAAAYELHNGIPKGATTKSPGPNMVRAMTTELWLGFPGVRLDSAKANRKAFKINLLTPLNSEKCVVELGNSTLTSIQGFQDKNAELTITINREDLVQTMMGAATFHDQTSFDKAKLNGDRNTYEDRNSMLFHFDLGFEMMPGTESKDLTPEQKLFEQEEPAAPSGG